ncbi:hypothetical protein EBU99_05585 [bacterium]|nr:hypothetical protein [bacterium]
MNWTRSDLPSSPKCIFSIVGLAFAGLSFFTLLTLSPAVNAAPRAGAQAALLDRCSGSRSIGMEALQALLAETSVSELQVRQSLLTLMRDPSNGCRKTLEGWLQDIKSKPSSMQNNTGRLAAMTLGLLLDLPVAVEFVEAEAASSGGLEWLATLEHWDRNAYSALLRKWIVKTAEQSRSARALQQPIGQIYGRVVIEEGRGHSESKSLAPMILNLYLKNIARTKPSAEEFFALNIHFAAANAGARQIFQESYVELLRANAVAWMTTFRSENAWTQFQLIDLMGRVGGSEMVKELLWLSQNHMDTRIKSRASQVLDETLKSR